MAQSGGRVGDAEPGEFAIGVEPVPVPIGDTASGQDAVGVSDQGDPAAVPTNASQSSPGSSGHAGHGTPASMSPTTAIPCSSKPNSHVTTNAKHDAGERSGHPRGRPLEDEDQHERADTHRRRRPMDVVEVADEVAEPPDDVVARQRVHP